MRRTTMTHRTTHLVHGGDDKEDEDERAHEPPQLLPHRGLGHDDIQRRLGRGPAGAKQRQLRRSATRSPACAAAARLRSEVAKRAAEIGLAKPVRAHKRREVRLDNGVVACKRAALETLDRLVRRLAGKRRQRRSLGGDWLVIKNK
jgi:hypothetical protein